MRRMCFASSAVLACGLTAIPLAGCGAESFQSSSTATTTASTTGAGGNTGAGGTGAGGDTGTGGHAGAGGGQGGTGGGTGAGGGTGGADAGPPPSCVPSENPKSVADGCGVFVSTSGSDSNAGTQAKPFKTFAKALTAVSSGDAIYACGEAFTEAVKIDTSATIYGALDCANKWKHNAAKKTALTAPSDSVPLTMTAAASGTKVFDFAITAANAGIPGGSSIAVIADGATAEMTRCDLAAGKGADGALGTSPDSNPPPTPTKGADGAAACSAPEPISGGKQSTNDCGGGSISIGGKGGDGNNANGGVGGDGQTGGAGQGGKGEPVAGGWSCQVGGSNGGGNGGDNGTPGTSGLGATGLGTLTGSGYGGVSGTVGLAGSPGQGGGGGGGAKGGPICPGLGAGASGGAGGAGGCGGQPGTGGGAGGASIALASVGATLTLVDCTLKAGAGGVGGAGGNSQPGASGGDPGKGGAKAGTSHAACDGGKGGEGGNGGPGGGGLGGHSLGIAFTGGAPVQQGTVTITAGTVGLGGLGGNGNVPGNGTDGNACKTIDFANAASCAK